VYSTRELRGNEYNRVKLLIAFALAGGWAFAGSALAQISIGNDTQVDARPQGSGYFPGDSGYWIGSSPDGYSYDCWGEDRPSTGEWTLSCRTYLGGSALTDPVQIQQSFETTVFFPTGCSDDGGNVYLAWSGNGDLFISHSVDRGLSWTAPQRVDSGPSAVVRTAEPRIACDGSGRVYLVWKDSRDGDHHVYFNRSLDSGDSWEPSDVRVDSIAGAVDGYRYGPIIAADSLGDVYVGWVKNGHLYLIASNDAGQTWGSPETALDRFGVGDPAGSRPSIAADDSGHVYVAWTIGQMYLNRSDDFGTSWLATEQQISDSEAVIAAGGTITADRTGHVYGLWFYQAPGEFVFTVRFNSSSDYGVTWAPRDTLLGPTDVGFHPFIPHLASDDNGGVFAIWLRYVATRTRHVYGNASFDYGASWAGGTNGFQVDSAAPEVDINSHEPFVSCDQRGTATANWLDRRDTRQNHMYQNSFGLQ